MYDSPIEYCAACKAYVALDQPQDECALEHHCGRGPGRCPLVRFLASPASTTFPKPRLNATTPAPGPGPGSG